MRSSEHRALFKIIQKMMAKEPEDRFQNSDELIEALSEGKDLVAMLSGPTEAATTYPRTEASSSARPSRAQTLEAQDPPPTTPSTPIPSPPRQEAVYIVQPKKRRTGILVGMFLLLLFGGAGGGGYFYVDSAGGIEPVVERHPIVRTLLSKIGLALANDVAHRDSLQAAAATDTTTLASVAADSTVVNDSLVTPPAPEETKPTTGHLIVSNTGTDASMWIDGRPVRGLRHNLPPGRHELRVVAPGRKPYTAAVSLAVGDTLRHRVRMVSSEPVSHCVRFDETYNRRGECYDQMPRATVATFVTLDQSVPRAPSKPATLNVRVRIDGSAAEVLIKAPSDVPEFTLLAIQFAKGIRYEPAMKNGRPVEGWAQVAFFAQQ